MTRAMLLGIRNLVRNFVDSKSMNLALDSQSMSWALASDNTFTNFSLSSAASFATILVVSADGLSAAGSPRTSGCSCTREASGSGVSITDVDFVW